MKRSTLVNLGLAVGVTVAFAAALEGLARVVAPAPPAPREVAEYIWDWDDMMPGGFYVMRSSTVGWPPWEEFNVEGLRDRTRSHEKPDGTWRIAVLGDSVTLGAGVHPREAYPRVLEEQLMRAGRRIEVMSVALWGWSTRQERIAWHRIARDYDPDEAILAVCLNDIPELHNNLARPPRWLTWLYERSALVRLVVGAESREIEDVERLFGSPEATRVKEALARFFEEIRTLRREVEDDGARFAVIVFPFRFQLEEDAPPPVVQEKIGAFCRDEGLTCVDFLPVLERMGEEAFLDYDHLSVAGASLTADTLQASALMPDGFSAADDLSAWLAERPGPGKERIEDWLVERAHTPDAVGIRVLGQALEAGSRDVRLAGAWALRALGPAAASEAARLVTTLRTDESTGVRAAAARALGAVLSHGEAGDRTTPEADDEPPAGKRRAPATPGAEDERTRSAVVEPLLGALADPSEAVRHAAADALFEVGIEPGEVEALTDALASDDPYVRGFAAWSLGNLGSAAGPAVPALVAALDREKTEATVIGALARIGPAAAPAVPRLVETLHSDDVDRRWRAARTLGRIGEPARSATPDLIAALSDDVDAGVRRHAARALGRVAATDGPGPAALQRATGDRNAQVRNEARRALERLAGRPPARSRADR